MVDLQMWGISSFLCLLTSFHVQAKYSSIPWGRETQRCSSHANICPRSMWCLAGLLQGQTPGISSSEGKLCYWVINGPKTVAWISENVTTPAFQSIKYHLIR